MNSKRLFFAVLLKLLIWWRLTYKKDKAEIKTDIKFSKFAVGVGFGWLYLWVLLFIIIDAKYILR